MRKLLLAGAAALSLAACTPAQQGATIGAATGAVIGGASTGTVTGTVVGAGVGAVGGAIAGELLGRNANNSDQCYYRDARGRVFVDVCPKG